ncbi:T-cell ecto-ADP-ribosyltransferase 1-like isoform X2 [Oratosquilla oratoria]|uniref:T-cell ecto-ADP-ribosyltransferase 1-like isoform X2 n=1 Tax=Oratosquilla oratoria TaxID=337810 RepID=UPI003F775C22
MEEVRTHRFVETNSSAVHIGHLRAAYDFPPQIIFGFDSNLNKPLDEVIAMLEEDRKKSRLLDSAWARAEVELNAKKREHIRKQLQDLPAECKAAIVTYTLNHPNIYEDFNEKSRHLDTYIGWDVFPYQGMWLLLQKAVSSIKYHDAFHLYRGCSIDITADVGSKIRFKQFVSVTPNRKVAENFAQEGTVFIFLSSNPRHESDESVCVCVKFALLMSTC